MAEAPLLELRGITKRFPGVLANDHVNFDLRRGEVHALLGENGAGKSTLMNILYGLYTPDEGEILLNGEPVELGSTKAAIEHGIGMVHQHFMLIPVMTVAENIVLATEPTQGRRPARLRRGRESACARSRSATGSPSTRTRASTGITVGQQQRVEILKALYRGADILILDEPTAVLTPQEAEELFEILRALKARGSRSSSSRTSCTRCSRSPTASPCCDAAGRRHDPRGRRDRGGPRAHDGRARGAAASRQEAGRTRRAAAPGRGPARRSTTAASRRCAASASRCARGEILGLAGVDATGRAS